MPSPLPKAAGAPRKKVTLQTIARLHREGTPITVMTAHDYPSGLFVERAGIDITLVGDSLAMVALGYDSTNEITLDEMIHHSRAVARGSKTPFLVADLPFGSYELSPEHALASSLRLIKEARGVDAVKLEGGAEMADTVRRIVAVGVPVLGHIGLTPQRASALGGFRVQGTTLEKAKSLLNDALALQASGVFAVVLEAVPSRVAAYITARLAVPTIGIGAGPRCSGQVLVQLDALGVYDRLTPKFCKRYADLGQVVPRALREYAEDVREGRFPVEGAHTYSMAKGEEVRFEEWCEAEDRARAEGARTGGGDGERR
ncbi:ketopantoate hydroxymethyltransferase [Zopfochytrium polystomum]|nr:ketopantoate hydroxymethyltransferase [Zopfochytrium polystomum]